MGQPLVDVSYIPNIPEIAYSSGEQWIGSAFSALAPQKIGASLIVGAGKAISTSKLLMVAGTFGGKAEKLSTNAVIDEIEALRRIGANAKTYRHLHQTIRLKGVVVDEFLSQPAGLSRNEIKKYVGPVIAGILDKTTGEIFLGRNSSLGDLPKNLVSILDERISIAREIKYEKTHGVGSHAEVYALNDALEARPGANLDEFLLYTINAGQRTSVTKWGFPVPRCPHCEYITEGVDYHPASLTYWKY